MITRVAVAKPYKSNLLVTGSINPEQRRFPSSFGRDENRWSQQSFGGATEKDLLSPMRRLLSLFAWFVQPLQGDRSTTQEVGDSFKRLPPRKEISFQATITPSRRRSLSPISLAPVTFGATSPIEGVRVGKVNIIRRADGKQIKAVVTYAKETASSYDPLSEHTYNIYVKGTKVGYTNLEKETGRIYVRYMEAPGNDTYKLIGTRLHQIAIEDSLSRGFGGRVSLFSLSEAACFHYKSGFRSRSRRENREIAQAIQKARREGVEKPDFDYSLDMYLPYSQIQLWKRRIARAPILEKAKLQHIA